MKVLNNDKELKSYCTLHPILSHLYEMGIPMKLLSYKQGETLIDSLDMTRFLQFVVKGKIHIYGIRKDGSLYTVSTSDGFAVIGDVELIDEWLPSFIVDAISPVTCIAISISETRVKLLDDNLFLRFLSQILAEKLSIVAEKEVQFAMLDEKLINFMAYECPDQTITSVEHTRLTLKCSRRQLQRILKQFVLEGRVEKIGKGKYVLRDKSH